MHRFALALLLLAPLAACPHAPPPPVVVAADPAGDLSGSWYDDSGAVTVLDATNGLHVVTVVDDDGEVFKILQSGTDEAGRFWFTYQVPSTEFIVKNTIVEHRGNELSLAWQNHQASGTDTLVRR